MKAFICFLIGSVFYLALADINNTTESVVAITNKNSDSKPKRDVSLHSGAYHGPSYKYLPPIPLTYNSYASGIGSALGFSAGHISGIRVGYRPKNAGHDHRHQGVFTSDNHKHKSASSNNNGKNGFHFPSHNHYSGHSSTQYFVPSATLAHGDFLVSPPDLYDSGHGYGSTGSSVSRFEYKLRSPLGGNADAGSGYHISKSVSESLPSLVSSELLSNQALLGSHGSDLKEEHHRNRVHNGAKEHVYVISDVPTGFENSHSSVGQQGNQAVSPTTYLPPTRQNPFSFSSYGVPFSGAEDSFNTKYKSQSSASMERGSGYDIGNKGLGYFSYIANKPQAWHTSISDSSFQQPSYSQPPFKPSIFLGAKLEDSTHNDILFQNSPPLEVETDSADYDYSITSGHSTSHQRPIYQQILEVEPTSGHEPDFSHLLAKNNQDTLKEISPPLSRNLFDT